MVFRKEIPLDQVRFRIPRRQLIRQSLLSAALMSLPIGSFFLDIDPPLRWALLGLSACVVLFSFLFAGVISEGEMPDAEQFYGRGTLIFMGISWLALIIGTGVALYLKFPRP